MQRRKKLNVAMIGAGFMGRIHSNAYHQVGHFFDVPFELTLKTVCSRDEEKLREVASHWGWEETATVWEKVVNRPDIDVVDICTPNFLHEPIALAAAAAGKIVWCEKPLAHSVEAAERMAQATRNLQTLVWFCYRRAPAVTFAKQLVEEGRIGKVYHYRGLYLQSWGKNADPSLWRFEPNCAGSGVMGDLLSHSLDLATWLNGPIKKLCSQVQTFADGRKVDDAVSVLAEFRNGSMGTFEATRFGTGNLNRNSFELNGSDGALEFNQEEMNRLRYNDLRSEPSTQGRRDILVTGPGHPYVDNYWPPGHIIGYEHLFTSTLADFLIALENDEPFHSNFVDALEIQRLLESVVESSRRHSWIDI